jgi:hypothetical protein
MKAKYNIVVAILSIILFQGWYNEIYGQIKFASSQLEQLANKTSITLPSEDGVYYRAEQFNELPLTIIVKRGEVTHIGLSLFTISQRQFVDELICNFLERTALAAEIPDFYGVPFTQYLNDQKIELFEGQWDNIKTMLNDSCFIFQSSVIDDKNYINCWYTLDATERYLTIAYPANYHLISGFSMIEAENRLYDDVRLTNNEDSTFVEPDSTLLQRIGNSPIYLLRGDIYYLPGLNSNRYYVADTTGRFDLLFSEDFPIESLFNLMTGTEIENQYVINAKLVKYGYQVDDFIVSLKHWLIFCAQTDCLPYFGILSKEENIIEGELIMHNKSFGYCHVMKLSIDPSLLKSREGNIQARLNSYVPMSNVKTLFDENKKK